MSGITTHVLDTARGRPASGVKITLEGKSADGAYRLLGSGATDGDGRARSLLPERHVLEVGVYRISFDTAAYFSALGVETFYPSVTITFEIKNAGEHYHVPLLISPFAFSTYRGS